MTREEVEERLEEYAAYKAIKEDHEDIEENPPETDDDSLENGVGNNSQNSDKEKEEETDEKALAEVTPLDEESQDEADHPPVPSLDELIKNLFTGQVVINFYKGRSARFR